MEVTIKLDKSADIPFLKKLLSQLSGIKSIEFSEGEKIYSWEEIESHELFRKALDKSFQDVEEGRFVEDSPELMGEIFGK